jgi:hypothetical protein
MRVVTHYGKEYLALPFPRGTQILLCHHILHGTASTRSCPDHGGIKIAGNILRMPFSPNFLADEINYYSGRRIEARSKKRFRAAALLFRAKDLSIHSNTDFGEEQLPHLSGIL